MMGRLLRRQWMHYTAQEEALGPPHVRITCGRGEKKKMQGGGGMSRKGAEPETNG